MNRPEAIERFTNLYDYYSGKVYAYAVSRAGRQLADEVVSEVYLVAWRRIDAVPSDPLPWLLVVARNVIMNEFRASARQQSLAAEFKSWMAEPVAADIAEQVTERHVVLRAVAELSEADRELLTLVAWHGLSPRQVARVTGCSTATYFVRLHRARARLRAAMSGEPGGSKSAAPLALQIQEKG